MIFKSVDNLQFGIQVSTKYMNDQYNVDITKFTETNPRVVMYSILGTVEENPKHRGFTLKQLNNAAIHEFSKFYIDKYNIIKDKKPSIKSLDRESMVYGDRPVSSIQMKPQNTNIKSENERVDKDFSRLQKMYNFQDETNATHDSKALKQDDIDAPLTEEEFSQKMTNLERVRFDIPQIPTTMQPKDFYKNVLNVTEMFTETMPSTISVTNEILTTSTQPPQYTNFNQGGVINIPTQYQRHPQIIYSCINGFDRDPTAFPGRFNFAVDLSKFSKTYRNISKLEFNCLIIPAEIPDTQTLTNIPKTTFKHGFGLSSPYLMLQVNEFPHIYDGLNNQTQLAFTQFLYDSSYQSGNGRGYVIMRPSQNESKDFHPNPLSSIPKLTFKIIKPNGSIVNESKDDYQTVKLEYEVYNSLYLKVVTHKYFDKNEFYVGDNIMIRNYLMPYYTSTELDSNGSYQPAYIDYINNRVVYDKIINFINRESGHDVMKLGEANEHGFYKNFYIYAPTTFDQKCGKLVVDKQIVDTIHSFNAKNVNSSIISGSNVVNPGNCFPLNGNILNASLQCTLSMKMEIFVGDTGSALQPQIS